MAMTSLERLQGDATSGNVDWSFMRGKIMRMKMRPPAVPLITVDPYFSVWSMADRLTDDITRHWTGSPNSMVGVLKVDGKPWRFMGLEVNDKHAEPGEIPALPQTELDISATSTTVCFACGEISLEVKFTTPLLLDDLKLMSRPVTYVSFSLRSVDGCTHDTSIYFDVTGQLCVDDPSTDTAGAEQYVCAGMQGARVGRDITKDILSVSGDDLRIDWGWLCILPLDGTSTAMAGNGYLRRVFIDKGSLSMMEKVYGGAMPGDERLPLAAVQFDMKIGNEPETATLMLAYDDTYSIDYFGKFSKAYCFKDGETFEAVMELAAGEHAAIMERCTAFDETLRAEAEASCSREYAELLALAYRQAIAAHKLISDEDGAPVFLSKECYSNGCIATVDVSYPSIPLFLLFNPELVRAMIRPIVRFARSPAWPFNFAPHDAGRYPIANGQAYGRSEDGYYEERQMPVEECGNMLIMVAAACASDGDYSFAHENLDLLTQWVSYLKRYGQDPGKQLCTDDFAGHLDHNANLAVKAIVAIGAYAQILNHLGKDGAEDMVLASGMAEKWVNMAVDDSCFRLTFDGPGTWSMKYNLLFDRLLGLDLFPKAAVDMEIESYAGRFNRYGLPLDSRETYTKADWLLWCAAMAPTRDEARSFVSHLWKFYNETGSRVPLTDWYDTVTGRYLHMRNRSVVGGLFALLLKEHLGEGK